MHISKAYVQSTQRAATTLSRKRNRKNIYKEYKQQYKEQKTWMAN